MKKRNPNHWLSKIEDLKPGEPCEVKSTASGEWIPAVVVENGGAGYWRVRVVHKSPAPANWAVDAFEQLSGVIRTEKEEFWSPHIEQVRLPGQTEAWRR